MKTDNDIIQIVLDEVEKIILSQSETTGAEFLAIQNKIDFGFDLIQKIKES